MSWQDFMPTVGQSSGFLVAEMFVGFFLRRAQMRHFNPFAESVLESLMFLYRLHEYTWKMGDLRQSCSMRTTNRLLRSLLW